MEQLLKQTLRPISPDQNFVNDLHMRLLMEASSPGGLSRNALLQYFFLTTGLLMSLGVLILMGIRVFIAAAGLVGILHTQLKNQLPKGDSDSIVVRLKP